MKSFISFLPQASGTSVRCLLRGLIVGNLGIRGFIHGCIVILVLSIGAWLGSSLEILVQPVSFRECLYLLDIRPVLAHYPHYYIDH